MMIKFVVLDLYCIPLSFIHSLLSTALCMFLQKEPQMWIIVLGLRNGYFNELHDHLSTSITDV